MSLLPIAALVVAILTATVAASTIIVVALTDRSRSRGIEVTAIGPTTLAFRTPMGSGTATLVVHERQGRVYEVETRFRGEPVTRHYLPPSQHLVRTHLASRVATLTERRGRVRR